MILLNTILISFFIQHSILERQIKIGDAMEKKELKKIPIEEAMEFFRKEGMEMDKEEAVLVMEFLNNLVLIVIQECFDLE
ncbi:hypothetical protein [Flavobacterium flavipallidum]|uniref:Uncharacterized protein n=1 Tax=Flavobacterium flavipallidum TaxID=3139140 RepID=A0ABU9HJV5_9FLAO